VLGAMACMRHHGAMLSRDAVAAEEEQLVVCAVEQSKYCLMCTVAS
jgi:hypothetical protein